MNKKTKLFFCLISTTLVSCEPSLIVNKTFTGLSLSHKLSVEEDIYKFSNANPDHFYSPRADFIKDLQDKKVTIKDEKSHQIIDSYYISKTKEAYFYFSYADQTTQVKNDKIKDYYSYRCLPCSIDIKYNGTLLKSYFPSFYLESGTIELVDKDTIVQQHCDYTFDDFNSFYDNAEITDETNYSFFLNLYDANLQYDRMIKDLSLKITLSDETITFSTQPKEAK